MGIYAKEHFGSKSYTIGFGTHTGTVAAAKNWGDAMQVMPINDSLADSYEQLCHKTNITNFTLPLREEHFRKKLEGRIK